MSFGKTLTGAIAACLLIASQGSAQNRGDRSGGPPAAVAASQDSPSVSVDFPGGTLAQYVAALRGSTKEPVNIMVQGTAAKVPVEAMQLRDVTVATALRAALEPRLNTIETAPDGTVSQIYMETIHADANEGKPVYVVAMKTGPGRRAVAQSGEPTVMEVYSIQRLVRADGNDGAPAVPEQVALSAIDTGLRLAQEEGAAKPEIQYHKDSGLLLVRGRPGDVRMVGAIIHKMMDDQEHLASDTRHRKLSEIRLNTERQRAEIALQLADQKYTAMAQHMGELQQQVKAGVASTGELSQFQLVLAQQKAELQNARIDMDRVTQEAQLGVSDQGEAGAPPGAAKGGGEPRNLDAELLKAQQEIRDLKSMIQQMKAQQNSAPPPGGKAKPKGE